MTPRKPGPCLGPRDIDLCAAHLLLRRYGRVPAALRRHVAACLQCRKAVVETFARRWTSLARSMTGLARPGPPVN